MGGGGDEAARDVVLAEFGVVQVDHELGVAVGVDQEFKAGEVRVGGKDESGVRRERPQFVGLLNCQAGQDR